MPDAPRPVVPVAVVIAAQNEELHIARCLDSVQWASQRFVVDAMSSDRTREFAEQHGATVVEHEWRGYSAQKNWAITNLPFTVDWVLCLDADEAVSPELADAIRVLLSRSARELVGGSVRGYYVNRRLHFLGRPMTHAWWYPDRSIRLFRRDSAKFDERSVHERVIVSGDTGTIDRDLIHANRKSLHEFLARHNRYSTLEALELDRARIQGSRSDLKASFMGDWGQRRRALRDRLWSKLPPLTRPLVRFLYTYFWRRGLLDGREGLFFCLLIAAYELQIDAKVFELSIAVRDGNKQDLVRRLSGPGVQGSDLTPPLAGYPERTRAVDEHS